MTKTVFLLTFIHKLGFNMIFQQFNNSLKVLILEEWEKNNFYKTYNNIAGITISQIQKHINSLIYHYILKSIDLSKDKNRNILFLKLMWTLISKNSYHLILFKKSFCLDKRKYLHTFNRKALGGVLKKIENHL